MIYLKLSYKTVKGGGRAEVVEKKSKFISHVQPVETEAAAQGFLADIRKKHYDASHNVYAYIIGQNSEFVKQSDDGEPSGTSGMPTLNAIKAEGLINVIVVVTRYFGGTLLGTGGLVRAYGKAAREGLLSAGIIEMVLHDRFIVTVDYPLLGKFQYEYNRQEYKISEVAYGEKITFDMLIETSRSENFKKYTLDLSSGTAFIEFVEKLYR